MGFNRNTFIKNTTKQISRWNINEDINKSKIFGTNDIYIEKDIDFYDSSTMISTKLMKELTK